MLANATNGHTPGHVLLVDNVSIYAPTHNWGIQKWDDILSFKEGDVVLNTDAGSATNNQILEFTSLVNGQYTSKDFGSGEYVFNSGAWFEAGTAATKTDVPHNPATTSAFSASKHYEEGMAVNVNGTILVANSAMKGEWNAERAYATGDVVFDKATSSWFQLNAAHHGDWDQSLSFAVNDTVEYGGSLYQWTGGGEQGLRMQQATTH